MTNPERYIVTSALPYANGPLHVGHLSGAYLPADVYVRFLRIMGKDVLFVCGSDEHGAAITLKARKEGVHPREIIDKYHGEFKQSFEKIGLSFDIYHRTSSDLHHETSAGFFKKLYEKGEFVEKESSQYFDQEAQQFLADRYIKGECPKCGYSEAYGDQCESCGSSLNPIDLINPISTLSGQQPVLKSTRHWYLPLDRYEDWLRDYILEGKLDGEEHHDPNKWKNHVIGQCKSWIDGGLEPRAMTRDLDWGVDVPQDIPGSEGKKLYVWLDAPIGYISATRQWALENAAKGEGGREDDWKKYWMDKSSCLIHFIGKDNIVFHCLIFPAILKAHGDYVLPKNVPANQFMNLEGKKISTSRNWAVWMEDFLDRWQGMEDSLRYYCIKNMPEQKDSEFTWKGFQEAHNNELVNNLANFINRVIVLTNKYYNGSVPEFDENLPLEGNDDYGMPSYHETELMDLFDRLDQLCESIRSFELRNGLKQLMELSSYGNQFLQNHEPWKLQKSDPDSVAVVMNVSLQIVAAISVAIYPFLPFTSEKIRTMLALEPIKGTDELLVLLDSLSEGEVLLPTHHKIGEPTHLFTRIKDELIEEELKLLHESQDGEKSKAMDRPRIKENVEFENFSTLDLRTATIVHAEKVPKTKKLLKLEVDLGFERRTIVSGIAEHHLPEEVIGKKVTIVANLAPKNLRGILSNGMILMAEDNNGRLEFVSPPQDFEDGFTVR
ncbi:MAG: methionine--tRNA ligase [Saprospirales bacterium]|nr:MAG: methionine--tRNA ligase [Saprospirales bacterium]